MRPINQTIVERVFEVTDAIPMSREAIRIPLGMVGAGAVSKMADGRFEIVLPEAEGDLEPFLGNLETKLRALGVSEAPPTRM